MRQFGKLFNDHILGKLFHIHAGTVNAVAVDVVAYLLFRVFQHHFIGAAHAPVIHDGKVLVLDKQVIAPVLQGSLVGVLFIHAVPVIIFLGAGQQPLIVPFVPQFVQPACVVCGLEVGHGRIECLFLWRDLVSFPFRIVFVQSPCNPVHLLRDYRGCLFYIHQGCLDELRGLFQ